MNANEKLIQHFYTCFQQKDIEGMQNCYADEAVFSDAVFKNLNAHQTRKMWEMLIKSGKDMRIEFSHIRADEYKGSAEWVAYYTFSQTGRAVVNRIKASFLFEGGKIIGHEDTFDFYRWAKQALGLSGLILGWTNFLKKKVQYTALQKLKSYMDIH